MPFILREYTISNETSAPGRRNVCCRRRDGAKQEARVRTAPQSETGRIRLTGHGVRECEDAGSSALEETVNPIAIDFKTELHGVLAANPRQVFDKGIAHVMPILVIAAVELHRRNLPAAEVDLRECSGVGGNPGNPQFLIPPLTVRFVQTKVVIAIDGDRHMVHEGSIYDVIVV